MRWTESEICQPVVGVAEAVEFHVHFVHDAEVEAAQPAVVVARVSVVEDAAGLQRAAQVRPP